jgi:hypothetical protein
LSEIQNCPVGGYEIPQALTKLGSLCAVAVDPALVDLISGAEAAPSVFAHNLISDQNGNAEQAPTKEGIVFA